jgi:hypothetical protein
MEGGVCLQYQDGKVRSNLAVPYGASGRYEDIVLPAMAETAARCAGVIGVDRAGLKQALRDGNFFCAWQHENAASKFRDRCGNHE